MRGHSISIAKFNAVHYTPAVLPGMHKSEFVARRTVLMAYVQLLDFS